MNKDSVTLRTFDKLLTAFFGAFGLKILILFIFKYFYKNNIRNLKWSSKLKTKTKKMSFKVTVFCNMSVLQNDGNSFQENFTFIKNCSLKPAILCMWSKFQQKKVSASESLSDTSKRFHPQVQSTEAAVERCSQEKMFGKYSENLRENTHAKVGFQ